MHKAGLRFEDSVASPAGTPRQEPFSADPLEAQRQYDLLLKQFGRSLLAFLASRVLRSDLDDISQVIWTRIWERRASFVGGNFRAWMFEIARNQLIDAGRKKRPDVLHPEYDATDAGLDSPLEILLDRERFDRLNRCLERLDAKLAELVRGRLRNESYEMLAGRLDLEPQQAHRRLHAAKQQLRDCVSEG